MIPAMNEPAPRRVGIDLGGTKTEGVVLAENPVEPVYRKRFATPRSAGYDGVLTAVVDLARELLDRAGSGASLGIGIPGIISTTHGRVKNENTTDLIGRPLQQDLEERLGRPVRVENDANCFALAEALHGAGRTARCVFGVILGTGVGGGIVFDGRIWPGAQGIAGEWGHTILEPDGPPCYCGRRGCVETFLSGPG
ncbi:MAG: ROK family protein, partial [Candidatus Eisenbacteria bacterium]|nr:ROK family protein [Candidatus Latescibacterota bacterium]MBD3301458.1 ROK family protein [Candidatus Eisenbacteria bacterium]